MGTTLERRPGASKRRYVEAIQAKANIALNKQGWVDSIEHAAKSIDLSWDPEFGWIDLEEDKIEDYDLQVPQKSRSHPHASPRSVVITASHFPKNGSCEYKNYCNSNNESNVITKRQQESNTKTNNSINLPDED